MPPGKRRFFTGRMFLVLSLIPLLYSLCDLFVRSDVRDGANFAHWEWTWGRFVEILRLLLTLPVAGGLLMLAAMRGHGRVRRVSIALFALVFCLCVYLGLGYLMS